MTKLVLTFSPELILLSVTYLFVSRDSKEVSSSTDIKKKMQQELHLQWYKSINS